MLPGTQPRYVAEPFDSGQWVYPADVSLQASAQLIHHDPAIYPDPYAFRPERFLGTDPGTYTWIPFGGGRRRCLGASFATLEMKIVLRTALASREFRALDPAPETAARRAIAVTPRRGASVTVGPAHRRRRRRLMRVRRRFPRRGRAAGARRRARDARVGRDRRRRRPQRPHRGRVPREGG